MHQRGVSFRIGGPLTPAVKKLMIINGALFLLQMTLGLFISPPGIIEHVFGLSHTGLLHEFRLWQLFTYMFLHGGFLHIFFNLLTLYMFAGELEEKWGSAFFMKYYIYSGLGAGIFIALMNFYIFDNYGASPVTIGASGALYAVLLAYGMTWPDREVLLYFLFPVKIKYMVIGFGLLEFFGTLSSATGKGGNISHIGHLGGLISGFVLLILWSRDRQAQPAAAGRVTTTGFFASYIRKYRLAKKKREIEKRIRAKKIIDNMLEKIARNGMGSLTSEEKSDLEWARRNYYPGADEKIH
jgi:membrane associated rhomboid family serine protease